MKKKFTYISGSIVLTLVLAGIGIYTSVIKLPITSEMQASWAFDITNVYLLEKNSDNVFIGRVIDQVGNESIVKRIPRTQFSVEVLANIKGNLAEAVVVDQEGGYMHGVLYVTKDDSLRPDEDAKPEDYLLQPGHVYIFATRHNKEKTRNTVSAPTQYTRISTDPTLSDAAALELAWQNPWVQSFVKAVQDAEAGIHDKNNFLDPANFGPVPLIVR